jgi:tetratricopeptide (TPR) repeat protein
MNQSILTRSSALALAALFMAFSTGCSGPKALTKQAHKYEASQLYSQAAHYYVKALKKKPGYIDALIGLRSTGQLVFDDLLGEFRMKAAAGDRAGAISAYEKARKAEGEYASVGVQMVAAPNLETDYLAIVNSHVTDLYDEAMALMDEQNYAGAAPIFSEVVRLEAGFRDAAQLLIIARAEPLYLEGEAAFQRKQYREAHRAFNGCLSHDPDYKLAGELRDQALTLGRFNIAINPFESGLAEQGAAVELRGILLDAMLNSSDPFIGVVDRINQEAMLAEQELALSGLVASGSGVAVGEMAGARGTITGSVMAFSVETSNLEKSRKKAHLQHKEIIENPDGTKTTKISYTDAHYVTYEQSRTAYLKFNITLISLETGAILFNQVKTVEASDAVSYARSQYPTNKLYPANSNGSVSTSGKHSLHRLLGKRQNLESEAALRSQLMSQAGSLASKKVETFLSSYVQ